ncbi:MAG: cytochrome C [Acidobacteriota bacterium]
MQAFKDLINWLCQPFILFTVAAATLLVAVHLSALWSKRALLALAGVFAVFMIWSFQDPNFYLIMAKADNVPISAMLVLIPFFFWLAMSQAYENDRRIASGQPPVEGGAGKDRILVWPDLVYTEMLSLILCTVILVVWSILLKAPIEEAANPTNSPNPSKAPWYFLGLQEMLVYFDPWLAGVVFPGLIIVGLMAIPYLDYNKKGNGYYTFKERRWEVTTFLFGFVVLWVMLIIYGTMLRGPNWNFFGPYETWDPHKLPALVNVNLSEFIYVKLLETGLPAFWLWREMWGILLILAYFGVLPAVLARTVFKRFYANLGFVRFQTLTFLLLAMAALPIKMYLRWIFNLKYIVAIPEFFFNI